MKYNTKVPAQLERIEKQNEHHSLMPQSHVAAPDAANLPPGEVQRLLANFNPGGLQRMTPTDMIRLSSLVGNQAVARMLDRSGSSQSTVQRDDPEEDLLQRRQDRRDEGDEEDLFGGSRIQGQREDTVMEDAGARSASADRAPVLDSVSDSINVDGQGLFTWNREMYASDVANVLNDITTNQSEVVAQEPILIFSGTHGNEAGNLVSTGAAGFVGEDQATANDVMNNAPESFITVFDVPNDFGTKADLTSIFGMTDYIRILAWCYSNRSYNNSDTLKANFWPEPDNL